MTVYNQGQIASQMVEEDEVIVHSIHAYWATHQLYRMSVRDFIEEFCGWDAIKELVTHKWNTSRERALIVALFLTGGRATEVLNLTKEMFKIKQLEDGRQYLYVEGMMLEKRYRKLGQKYVGDDDKNHFETEKIIAVRKPFAIMLDEPLAPMLLNWIEQCEGGLLFPSPYNKKHGKPLTRFWAYKYIRSLYERVPDSLKEALGMKHPFVINGEKIDDELHLWLHWFRSQRASQLVRDYNFDLPELMSYFSWLEVKTALRYLRKGSRELASKMKVAEYK
jgi:Phage integrase family.